MPDPQNPPPAPGDEKMRAAFNLPQGFNPAEVFPHHEGDRRGSVVPAGATPPAAEIDLGPDPLGLRRLFVRHRAAALGARVAPAPAGYDALSDLALLDPDAEDPCPPGFWLRRSGVPGAAAARQAALLERSLGLISQRRAELEVRHHLRAGADHSEPYATDNAWDRRHAEQVAADWRQVETDEIAHLNELLQQPLRVERLPSGAWHDAATGTALPSEIVTNIAVTLCGNQNGLRQALEDTRARRRRFAHAQQQPPGFRNVLAVTATLILCLWPITVFELAAIEREDALAVGWDEPGFQAWLKAEGWLARLPVTL